MISWLLGAAQAEPSSGIWGGTGSTVLVSPLMPWPAISHSQWTGRPWAPREAGSAQLSALCRNPFLPLFAVPLPGLVTTPFYRGGHRFVEK